MTYLLDANVFIEAKNRYYGLDFCPAFWAWLEDRNAAGVVFSVEHVLDELKAGADDLTVWAKSRRHMFLTPGTEVLPSLRLLSNWAASGNFDQAAADTFLQAADYYLVAHAHAHGMTVVTQEVASDTRKRIKIPNVCVELGIKFMAPFQMLRVEQARFVLDPIGQKRTL